VKQSDTPLAGELLSADILVSGREVSGINQDTGINEDSGRRLLVGVEDGSVSLFDLESSGPPRRIKLPAGCMKLAVDSRRNRAVVVDKQGAVIALSLPDLKVVHRLAKGQDGAVDSLALSPDSGAPGLLATGGTDRRVVLRDPVTFEALLTFPAWTGPVRDLGFDASGRWLALVGTDSEVGLWDLKMLHDELAAIGLAWDQPAPAAVSTADLDSAEKRSRPKVPIIDPKTIDPAKAEKAHGQSK
jgi:WD40 repeat protein